MRIAQIMLARRFGGAERSFVDLSIGLAERGFEVLAIGDRRGEALKKLPAHPNIQCEAVVCRGAWDRLCGHAIKRRLMQFSPAVVQTHLARAATLGGRAARACAIASLAKTHNLVNAKYYRTIDRLVATTDEQQAHLLACGVPAAAIVKIPNFSALEPTVVRQRSRGATLVIKSLGRFVRKKGFDILLRAFAEVLARGVDARIEIAGAGPEGRALEALVRELDLQGQVGLPGWTEDVRTFLADADLFVLPSREEPFGITLLEAMACGVPILSSSASGPLEILSEHTALLVEGDDPAPFVRAIVDVERNPDAAATRARAAQRRFTENYDANTVIDRYVAVYEDLARR